MLTKEDILKNKPLIIAGPCAVESRDQIMEISKSVLNHGAHIIRTQLWKPRSSPESFQGVGIKGLEWIKEVKSKFSSPIAMEIVEAEQIEQTKGIVDILWIGARNMQNFELLKKIGKDPRVVILKRGLINNVQEWIGAAKYCGIEKTILCERGVRTGADSMRFTLDLNSALVAKHDFGMDVLVDPSHSAGRRDMVSNLSLAAIAAGLDGVIVEVHNDPLNALSDADQQISLDEFKKLAKKINILHKNLI